MKINTYIGNGAYCYANSAAMLLATIGENVPPSLIEVLCGVGLSAFWMNKTNLLFFNFALPNEELTRAFNILGFDCNERIFSKNKQLPLDQLRKDLVESPAIIGPVDMGFLDYNPKHDLLYGSDHYIFIYGFEGNFFCLHDPANYPCVHLDQIQLEKSWKSDKIFYGLENYQYWTFPRRVKKPSISEIYDRAIEDFKSIYKNCEIKSIKNNWLTGGEAILKAAARFESNIITKEEVDHYKYFALSLGAKRALDFATFFLDKNQKLSELKSEQARLFGKSHSLVILKDWKSVANTFREYANVEEKFKSHLLSLT